MEGLSGWVDFHTVQKCLVVLELFVHYVGMGRLGHKIPGMGFTDMIFTCRGEWGRFVRGGSPVYIGTVGPKPDREVLGVDLTSMVVRRSGLYRQREGVLPFHLRCRRESLED
jgi:hypothetical protein